MAPSVKNWDSVEVKLYYLYALAAGNERTWIREKMLGFSMVLPTPSIYHYYSKDKGHKTVDVVITSTL